MGMGSWMWRWRIRVRGQRGWLGGRRRLGGGTNSEAFALAAGGVDRDGRVDMMGGDFGTNAGGVLVGDVPHVVSITRSSPVGPIASGSSVSYAVKFSEPVVG